MTGNELREAFLHFFELKGHKVLPSFPLVLPEDPTTLFTVAGMQPFVPVFRGEAPAPAPRVATSQKVFREGDLDIVGVIGRYHTFYEMLGNFSFGDYFKREAVQYGWEFVTEVMKLPPENLWFTVYEEDSETAGYWAEIEGVDPTHIVKLGKKDNWWPQNAWDGPCGPCSEIYLDRGEQWGCGRSGCQPGCDCDRYLEFWNLVFQMYIQDSTGKILGLLPHPGIDTGMGLERAAALVMDVASNYETDLVVPVVQALVEVLTRDEELNLAYVPLGPPSKQELSPAFSESEQGQSSRLRSISDHLRAATFLIADGVLPASDGRGSVLRRLIRRSFGHGWRLGVRQPFLWKVVPGVGRALGSAYPEIIERQQFIQSAIRAEEEQFCSTVEAGMVLLQRALETRGERGDRVVDGQTAFTLATTHGFPSELTRDVAAQYGFTVDTAAYAELMEAHRTLSKDPSRVARGQFTSSLSRVRKDSGATEFVGYDLLEDKAVVLAIVVDGGDREAVALGEEAVVVLNRTPFYAESGGQIGDSGVLEWDGGRAVVSTTTKLNELWLHQIRLESGALSVGVPVRAIVDAERRSRTIKNHTATHLMHAALHRVLGAHATQAGSLVTPERLRFDFTNPEPLTSADVCEVERIVEEWIDQDLNVITQECDLVEARAAGAMALFGEKYGDIVRMVCVGDARVSLELCGGTHVHSTGVIGLFHITSESGIGSGLRRIEAVTGPGARDYYRGRDEALQAAAEGLRCSADEVSIRVERLQQQIRDLTRQRDGLLTKGAQPAQLLDQAVTINGISVLSIRQDDLNADSLGKIADQAVAKLGSGIVVLASVNEGKVIFIAKVTKDLVKRGAHAGNLVKALASMTGGGGGGRPDFAQAGGRDPAAIDEALAAVPDVIRRMLPS